MSTGLTKHTTSVSKQPCKAMSRSYYMRSGSGRCLQAGCVVPRPCRVVCASPSPQLSTWLSDQHGNPVTLSTMQCFQYMFLHHNVIIAIGVFCVVRRTPCGVEFVRPVPSQRSHERHSSVCLLAGDRDCVVGFLGLPHVACEVREDDK